ncbi:MAG: 30S ribosomal protein S19, small subunit ribosomal protein S19 [archaeon GW2011_AR3]|nr:30S ribosomal protein S19, small subunit ribosomal protein S19 [uncultured archaeon]KHO46802.1 MAG: 30S ribosomal protein S19, small subunit ribosomal protein S19 [archaeon GW2011_AR3]MBS3109339.1 30S ribosomal protein S19 [Candidatus Woesearchaeota archaeon]
MAKKEFTYRGKSVQELKEMSDKEFAMLINSRERRKIVKRGWTEEQKKLLKRIRSGKRNIETHCRDMVIMPVMLGMTIKVFNGKEFVPIMINEEMLGHRLGEFSITRKRVEHSAPGIGATRSSSAISVR